MKKADFDKLLSALTEISRAAKFAPNASDDMKRACYEAAGRAFAKHEAAMYEAVNYVLRHSDG